MFFMRRKFRVPCGLLQRIKKSCNVCTNCSIRGLVRRGLGRMSFDVVERITAHYSAGR